MSHCLTIRLIEAEARLHIRLLNQRPLIRGAHWFNRLRVEPSPPELLRDAIDDAFSASESMSSWFAWATAMRRRRSRSSDEEFES